MLPERSAFLSELRLRNRGLIADDDQRRLGEARIAVAGCGSTGGAVVEPLVRAGAMHLALYEPGSYELDNLNRQRATVVAIGRNKAAWLAERAHEVNPYAEIAVDERGVTSENVTELCRNANLIVDAVDVTSMEGLTAKFALHEAAAKAGRVVVTAYDLAYRQYIRVFRYAKDPRPFAGSLAALRQAKNPLDVLAILVPVKVIPCELVSEIERLQNEPGASISQLGCTSDLFGAMIVPLSIELLAGRPVRSEMTIDLRDVMRGAPARWSGRLATLASLARLKTRMRPSS
jgi:molybdopterin/thiamine biosynthesis adenylyltransferase